MRRLSLALIALLPLAAGAADTASIDPTLLKQITAWRRDLHQHPELGNHETRTAALVAAQLRKLGLTVRTGVAHTGVVGVLKGGRPGPRLAIRADMDALPVTEEVDLPFASKVRAQYNGQAVGVMHACGHDAHTAMTLGLASALAARRKDLAGEVMFVFQPAEEGPPKGEEGGAPLMVKDGVFRDFTPDAVLGMHVVSALPVGTVALRAGGAMASSDTFRFTVRGRQSHGAQPWKGVDPIVAAAQIVADAQTIVSRRLDISQDPAVLTFGVFQAGQRFNIVPDTAHLEGTVRAFDEGQRAQALAALRDVVQHVAAAQGARIEDEEIPVAGNSNPVNYNDPALTARVRASLEQALGREQVQEAKRWTASEDFPQLGQSVRAPSVYFFVGATPAGRDPATAPSNHSPRFFLDEGALEVGTRAMLAAALDVLAAPAAH
ncbi:MAG TPA: amidohydrolase [Rhodanobacteraceae bacterium]|nr:amidohydrolase [Rhodanobacteraceae bacterium]